jgi:hypothetical protein
MTAPAMDRNNGLESPKLSHLSRMAEVFILTCLNNVKQ